MPSLPPKIKTLLILAKNCWKIEIIKFPRNALFHMKTRVFLKYFVHGCRHFHICLYHFFLHFVFFTFLVLFSSAWDTFYNLPCLIWIHYNQHSFSQQYFIQKIFTINCKQCFRAKKEMKRKNCDLLKNMSYLYKVSTISLLSLNFLSRSKGFTIMDNTGIFRLLFQCISISLIVKKDIFFILLFHSFRC